MTSEELVNGIVKGMANAAIRKTAEDVMNKMIRDKEIIPDIGFYKRCRKMGLHIRSRRSI
jgi:hypothetical protein